MKSRHAFSSWSQLMLITTSRSLPYFLIRSLISGTAARRRRAVWFLGEPASHVRGFPLGREFSRAFELSYGIFISYQFCEGHSQVDVITGIRRLELNGLSKSALSL